MNQVSWTRQFILAVILVTSATGAFYWEYKHKPAAEEKEQQAKHLFQLQDTPVKEIKVVHNNQAFEFSCSDFGIKLCKSTDHSKWEMTAPRKLRADDANVNSLLSSMVQVDPTTTIDLKDETPEKKAALLKEYGLDPDQRAKADQLQYVVETDSKKDQKAGPSTVTFYVGQPHPVSDAFFALLSTNDSVVYVIPGFFKSHLSHDMTHWRDKKLSTLATHDIASFELQSRNHGKDSSNAMAKIKAERKDGQWLLQIGENTVPGENEAIDQLLSAATTLNAKDFASEHKSDPQAKSLLKGFAPIVTLTLYKEKLASDKEAPAPITLTLYQKPDVQAKANTIAKKETKKELPNHNDKLYAMVSNLDPLYEVQPSIQNRLGKTLSELRISKLISTMERFSAKQIEFSGKPIGATPLVLAQVDGKWKNTLNQTEVDPNKVQQLLDKLSSNQVTDYVTGKKIPSGDQDGLIVRISDGTSDGEKAKKEFVFWKKDSKLFGRNLKPGEAFLLNSELEAALPLTHEKATDFFKKEEALAPTASQHPDKHLPVKKPQS